MLGSIHFQGQKYNTKYFMQKRNVLIHDTTAKSTKYIQVKPRSSNNVIRGFFFISLLCSPQCVGLILPTLSEAARGLMSTSSLHSNFPWVQNFLSLPGKESNCPHLGITAAPISVSRSRVLMLARF